MKKTLEIGAGLVLFLLLSVPMARIANGCGTGSYTYISSSDCRNANPANNCSVGGEPRYVNCYSNGTQCVAKYEWTGCYPGKNQYGDLVCEYYSNTVELPCDNYVKPTDKPGGCAPPPAPKDLVVDWGSPFTDQVRATWTPGTPGTPRPQAFAVSEIMTPRRLK